MHSCDEGGGPMDARPSDLVEQGSVAEVDRNVALLHPGGRVAFILIWGLLKEAPVEGVDKGSNGDKDSDDKDDPGEEDASDAVEKQDGFWWKKKKYCTCRAQDREETQDTNEHKTE